MPRFFDLRDHEIRDAYVEESFIADLQYEIHRLMTVKSISRAELARRMDVSAPYVTQLLGDEGANVTARTIVRVFTALGEEPEIRCRTFTDQPAHNASSAPRTATWADVVKQGQEPWETERLAADDCESKQPSGCAVVWLDAVRPSRRAA